MDLKMYVILKKVSNQEDALTVEYKKLHLESSGGQI